MFGDCDNCGHSIMYHAPLVGCLKCSCDEYSVWKARRLLGYLYVLLGITACDRPEYCREVLLAPAGWGSRQTCDSNTRIVCDKDHCICKCPPLAVPAGSAP